MAQFKSLVLLALLVSPAVVLGARLGLDGKEASGRLV
jgi:hypothetical protein